MQFALLGVVIFLTYFQQSVTGFGSTILSLPFLTLLIGLPAAVAVLVLVGSLIALFVVVDSWRQIVWREFVWIMVPVAVAMPVGFWLAGALPANGMKIMLAVFAVAVGLEGLLKHCREDKPTLMPKRARLATSLFLPLGGVLHGAIGAGGPFIVIYATRAITDKTLFRVTLSLLWAVLNSLLIFQWLGTGALTPHIWKLSALCTPFALAGAWLGNHAHYRTDGVLFRKIVYWTLIVSGLVLGCSVLR